MVETLLQLPKIEVFKFLPKATQGLQEWNVDRRLSGLEHRQSVMSENYTIQRAIEATFPVLIKRWPNTALRILNKYIQYDGKLYLRYLLYNFSDKVFCVCKKSRKKAQGPFKNFFRVFIVKILELFDFELLIAQSW